MSLSNVPDVVLDRCRESGSSNGIARGDFNGDGVGDLAIGVPGERFGPDATNLFQGAVYVLYGSTAAGLTATGSQFLSELDMGPEFLGGSTARRPQNGAQFGAALASGDFNGDGFSDLAIGAPRGTGAVGACAFILGGVGQLLSPCEEQKATGLVWVVWGGAAGLNAPHLPPTLLQFPGDLMTTFGGPIPIRPDYFAGDGVSAVDGGSFGSALAWGDFDGDGRNDLAVGAPRARVALVGGSPIRQGGAVVIFFGRSGRFRDIRETSSSINGPAVYPGRHQILTQQVSSVLGDVAEDGDQFGASLAGGDFDADSYTDLAVGVPREDLIRSTDAGAVELFYGSGVGLRRVDSSGSARVTFWSQGSAGVAGTLESGDRFGHALAAGDFNGDRFIDLAIGAPFEGLGTSSQAGAVTVLYGSITGIRATGSQFWNQAVTALGQTPGLEDRFGFALAAGDFNGDARADLAIGVPGETLANLRKVGMVHVIYGSNTGLNATTIANQRWTQTPTRGEGIEEGDQFGYALSSWNYGRGPQADLAVGVPFEDVGSVRDAGMVHVIYGGGAGLTGTGSQDWSQASPGLPVRPLRVGNMFGFTAY